MVLGSAAVALGLRWFPEPSFAPAVLFVSAALAIAAAFVLGPFILRLCRRLGPLRSAMCLIGLSLLVRAMSDGLSGEASHAVDYWNGPVPPFLSALSSNADEREGFALVVLAVALLGLLFHLHRTRLVTRLDALGGSAEAYALWEQGPRIGIVGARLSLAVGLLSGMLLAPLNYSDPHVGLTYGVHGFAILMLTTHTRHPLLVAALVGIVWGIAESLLGFIAPRRATDLLTLAVVSVLLLHQYGGLSLWRTHNAGRRLEIRISTRRLFENLRIEEYERSHKPLAKPQRVGIGKGNGAILTPEQV